MFTFGIYLCGLGLILLLVPNLAAPFNFAPPERLLTEDAESGEQLGVWRLEKS